MSIKVTAKDIAKMIDHSLLRPEMTRQQVIEGCEIAKKYDCAGVCVKPCDVALCKELLKDTDVKVGTVIGFPHGSNLTEVKLRETELAINQGCEEVDMVMNIGRFLSGDYDLVADDISTIANYAHSRNTILKVILENAYLTPEQIAKACRICESCDADFVKTSTGYAPGGATIPDLKVMRANCSEKVSIKAAGGVRCLDAALAIRAIGVARFGCTRTPSLMEDAISREKAGTLVLPDPDSVKEMPVAK